MKAAEFFDGNVDAQKSRIRSRYQGIDPGLLEVIPAKPVEGLYDDNVFRRVAVYARVSTDDPRQTSSYELQKNYYEKYVSSFPNWELVHIYADEGISGTSLQHRTSFNQMIADCRDGKIDMIITKGVSRFSRNIVDCIGIVNMLKQRIPPIGVLFENEQIFTLNPQSEMSLSFVAAMAQEESHVKSTSMNASYEMRFSHGIFMTPPLLGYDQDETGNLVVNREEAKTVRLIFFMYLYGYSTQQIANVLTKLEQPTKRGNITWSSNSVLGVLQNERHCGEVLAHKTFTPSYLDHKTRKNCGDRNQYRQPNHHEAIIAPEDYVAVQRKISNAKYGGSGIPELHVIPEGALKGFVIINPRWASFNAEDYRIASAEAEKEISSMDNIIVNPQNGDLDLRGYEIARTEFFNEGSKISVTLSIDGMKFGIDALQKLDNVPYVELLIHPRLHQLAVRPSKKEIRSSIKWATAANIKYYPKMITGAAFLPTLFELFRWNVEYRYRVTGIRRQKGSETVLLFDLHETVVLIPAEKVQKFCEDNNLLESEFAPINMSGYKEKIVAYPLPWAQSFGSEFYQHTQTSLGSGIDNSGLWNVTDQGNAYYGREPQPRSKEHIEQDILQLMRELQKEE
ncbi:MAG: recombinase family protein [Candidatus Gastranaerophilales bacterium]|nr:recombinase family protein [Candidatus Gastranaerophilales bacterium]